MMTAIRRSEPYVHGPALQEVARRVLYHAMQAHGYNMTRADFSGLTRQQAQHKIAFDLHGDSRFSFCYLIGQFVFPPIGWDCTDFTLARQVMHYAEPDLEWRDEPGIREEQQRLRASLSAPLSLRIRDCEAAFSAPVLALLSSTPQAPKPRPVALGPASSNMMLDSEAEKDSSLMLDFSLVDAMILHRCTSGAPAKDIRAFEALLQQGFSPAIRGHRYYAPLQFNSVLTARQWAQANGHANRPIVWKAGEGATYSLMTDVSAQQRLRELIAAGTRGTLATDSVHFDCPGITDSIRPRGPPFLARNNWLRFVHSHYPHGWTHQVITRHRAPAKSDSDASWLLWFTAPEEQIVQTTTGTSSGFTPWSRSHGGLAMIRARLRDHLPTIDRQYRRHVSGQGRAYRLRGGESQQAPGSEPRNGGRRNEGCSPTRAGRQTRSGTTPISTAAVTELREGGESAVFTTGGLDSSFAASTASTRRSGGRDGGGQEEEGASSHTEEEGDSYTEEEGTIGIGSSIWGGGGESVLSEQEGLARRLFRLLHRRWHPSRCSRSRLRRPQGAARFSAQHWRSAGAS